MRFRPILRTLAVFAAAFSLALPARAVLPEKDFDATLSSLLGELRQSYASAIHTDSLLVNNLERRTAFSDVLKSADEITVMLYTQRPEFAFDMAFALEEVSRVSEEFQHQVRLSEQYRVTARSGLRRYELLKETLLDMYRRERPDSLAAVDSLSAAPAPHEGVADPENSVLLDSCLYYADALTDLYAASVEIALADSTLCAETESRLRQAYEYAQENYAETQKNRYIGGNVNIIQILTGWDTFIRYVKGDLQLHYDLSTSPEQTAGLHGVPRAWNGLYVLTYAAVALVMLFVCFLLAGLFDLLVLRKSRKEKLRQFGPILTAILAILLFALGMLLFRADTENPYWRMAYQLLTQYAWLTLAIFISLLIRIQGDQARASLRIYIPTLLLAFLSILLRAIFLPASAVPLLLPGLLVFIIWQSIVNVRLRNEVNRADLRYQWVSVGVMSVSFLLSLAGYSMIGVLILTFWTFELALLHTITALYHLMKRYYEDKVIRKKATYHEANPNLPLENKDAFIEVTWFYDLLRMVVVPLMILASFPLSVLLTSSAYQLSLTGTDLLRQALIGKDGYEFLNLSNLLLVVALFFLFRYLIYLVKALFRVFRLRNLIDSKGPEAGPVKESDVNLSLSNTIFTLGGWLLYVIIAFSILHIPTTAITAISTGLAAGVGFALKDLINNFFYGIQLMAGRIRVGDKISCDGVRGVVKRVSYQTTQVEDEDGSLIAFTNTDLFSKQFRNLNSGKNYELIKIPVGVKYGTDVAFARKVILEALQPLMTRDRNGRWIVDPKFPVDVRFDGFGDSSVNLVVALYTTVETHYTFPSRAKEAIYNAFYENGIEIPFPQRDVYVKSVPDEHNKD